MLSLSISCLCEQDIVYLLHMVPEYIFWRNFLSRVYLGSSGLAHMHPALANTGIPCICYPETVSTITVEKQLRWTRATTPNCSCRFPRQKPGRVGQCTHVFCLDIMLNPGLQDITHRRSLALQSFSLYMGLLSRPPAVLSWRSLGNAACVSPLTHSNNITRLAGFQSLHLHALRLGAEGQQACFKT